MRLPLTYYGHPILRKKCQKVKELTPEVKQLIANMKESIRPPNEIGLAAPQVGSDLAIFITNVHGIEEDGDLVFGEPRVFINPVLKEPSEERELSSEGCLSIPGLSADVWRPLSVTVEAMDENGKKFEQRFSGFLARIIMHENDHLNGVLFIDRLAPDERKKIEPALQAIKRKFRS